MIHFHECTKATLEIVATLSLPYSTLPMNFTRPDLYNNFRRSRWKAATGHHRRRRTLIRLQYQPRKNKTPMISATLVRSCIGKLIRNINDEFSIDDDEDDRPVKF